MKEHPNTHRRQIRIFLRILLVAVFAVISLAVLQPKAEAVIPCKHLSSTWKVTRAATCTQTGLKQKVCTKCGAVVQTQTLPKVAHQSKGYYETVSNPTCTTDGKKVLKCRYCNVVMDSLVISRLGHNLSWVTTTEATCTQRGVQKQKCSRCSYVASTRTISMKQHMASPAGYVVVKSPTCTSPGKKVLNCKDCQAVLDELEISMLGHDCYVERRNATCTQDGWEEIKCARCGVTVDSAVRPALGHNLSWVTTTEATCTQYGVQSQKCSRCGTVANTKTLPMKDHVLVPATCTSPETCFNCHAEFGSPIGHKFSQPTCALQPGDVLNCVYCGCPSTDAPKTHEYNAWGMCLRCRSMSNAPCYSLAQRLTYMENLRNVLRNTGSLKVKVEDGNITEFGSDYLHPSECNNLNNGLQSELFAGQYTDYCPQLVRNEGDLYYYITRIYDDPDYVYYGEMYAINVMVVRCESVQTSENITMTVKVEDGYTLVVSNTADANGYHDCRVIENSCVPIKAEVAASSTNEHNRIMGASATYRQNGINEEACLEFVDNTVDFVLSAVAHDGCSAAWSAIKAVRALSNTAVQETVTDEVTFQTDAGNNRYTAGTMDMAVSTIDSQTLVVPGDFVTYTITCQNDNNNCEDIETYFYVNRAD